MMMDCCQSLKVKRKNDILNCPLSVYKIVSYLFSVTIIITHDSSNLYTSVDLYTVEMSAVRNDIDVAVSNFDFNGEYVIRCKDVEQANDK